MIFVVAQDAPILFVMLTAEDAMKLRQGNTLYVEPRMTGGRVFNQVIISQHKTKEEIVTMIRAAQPNAKIPDHLPEPPAREGEMTCRACGGSTAPTLLFEDTCITCWAAQAKRLTAQSN